MESLLPQLSGVIALAAAIALGVGCMALLRLLASKKASQQRTEMAAARQAFHRQRERLEAIFLKLASESGKPRGLQWVNCDFRDEVSLARDCETGALTALVAVTISFEAIEGGSMEDVEAVGNLRAATAVFQYDQGKWSTQGRAIMNLEPLEAIAHFRGKLAPIAD